MRIKVVHIVVAGQVGGAERLLADLAAHPALSGADHVIALMTPNRALAAHFHDMGLSIRDRGCVRENPLAYLWRSYGPSDIAWLQEIAERECANILHCHTYASHVLAARAGLRLRLPVLRTEHGVRHYRDPTCALNRHWALKNTRAIAAVSAFVGEKVAAIEPAVADRIHVIHNGIDFSQFPAAPPRTDGVFTVAVVARLEPVKRIEIALRALAMSSDIRLEIAGDGAERAKLEHLTTKLGLSSRVHFHGHLRDPRPVIAASDAVLNCTQEEALSLSLIEAAALARPAIAFNQGGVPEVVVDGRTGWLARGDTPEAFAEILYQAAADRTEAIRRGQEARAWVTARFGIGAMCEAYGRVYRSLLSQVKNGRNS